MTTFVAIDVLERGFRRFPSSRRSQVLVLSVPLVLVLSFLWFWLSALKLGTDPSRD
jgi:hypothetical protein